MNHRIKLENDNAFVTRLGKLLDKVSEAGITVVNQVTICFGESKRDANGNLPDSGYFTIPATALGENSFSSKGVIITRVRVTLRGLVSEQNRNVNLVIESQASHRSLILDFENRPAILEKVLVLGNLIEEFFPPLKISPVIDKNVESLLSDLHAIRDSITADSEQALSRLSESIANVHASSVERIDEHIRKRDEHFLELEEKHRAKIEAEQTRISELEKALMAKEASLNLKEPIGERRRIHTELRKRLIDQVENFRPSKSVNYSRTFVRMANFALIGISILAFAYFALKFSGSDGQKSSSSALISLADSKISNSESNDPASPFYILAYIKLTLSALAVFGFSAAYIRWEGRVADRLSETEFKIRDKAVDIERSAWIVETVEALTTNGKALPEGLLQLLGNNLFDNREHKESEAENLSNFLQHLVGKKGSFETHLPGGGSVTLKADGARPKTE